MTILEIIKQIARQVQDPIPTTITANDDTTNELLGYVEHGALRIFNEYNWQVLEEEAELITTPGVDRYNLPVDFDCMLSYGIYNMDNRTVITAETSDARLQRMMDKHSGDTDMRFRLQKNRLAFTYPWNAQCHLMYVYKSRNFVVGADTVGNEEYRDVFKADDDKFLLDNHLLISAAIAARSVLLQLDDRDIRIQEYNDLLNVCKNKDSALFKRDPTMFGGRALTFSKIKNRPGGTF